MEKEIEKLEKKISVLDKIIKLCPKIDSLKKEKEILRFIIGIKNSKFVISLIGSTGSGKSSFMNALIGEEIIPCQGNNNNKALIISHTNNDDIKIIKGEVTNQENFSIKETQEEKTFSESNKVADAKDYLKQLGRSKEKFEDSFYFVKIKMKIFEIIKEENADKIQFIDFPGLDKKELETSKDESKNDKPTFSMESLNNFFNICDSFIFVNEKDCVGEKGANNIMKPLFDQILLRKKNNYMPLNNMLFIFNKYETVDGGDNFESTKNNFLKQFGEQSNTKTYVVKFSSVSLLQYYKKKVDCEQILEEFDKEAKKPKGGDAIFDTDDEDKKVEKDISPGELFKNLENFVENKTKSFIIQGLKSKNEDDKIEKSIKNYCQRKNINVQKYEKEIKKIVSSFLNYFKDTVPEICQECITNLKQILNSLKSEREENIIEFLNDEYEQISQSLEKIKNNDITSKDRVKEQKTKAKINEYIRTYEQETNDQFNILETNIMQKLKEIEKIQFSVQGKEELEQLNDEINVQMEEKFKAFFKQLNDSKTKLNTNLKELMNNKLNQLLHVNEEKIKMNEISQYSSSIYENFKSKYHLISHGCWGAAHTVGAVTASVLAAANPITLAILGGGVIVHLFIVLGVSIKDLVNKEETIKKNLINYLKEVESNLFTFKNRFYSDFVYEKEKIFEGVEECFENYKIKLNEKDTEELNKLKKEFNND